MPIQEVTHGAHVIFVDPLQRDDRRWTARFQICRAGHIICDWENVGRARSEAAVNRLVDGDVVAELPDESLMVRLHWEKYSVLPRQSTRRRLRPAPTVHRIPRRAGGSLAFPEAE